MNLIKPIKSLADNWGINVANELELYLDELSNVIVSLDGIVSSTADDIDNNDDDDDDPHLPMKSSKRKKKISKMFSFAEAALIIQGSAMVYTKKVDFLHQLVITTLKLLREKTAATDISGKRKRNIDDDDTINGESEKRARTGTNLDGNDEEDDDFMLLDDCIPSISLKSTNNFQISKENDQNMMNRNLLKKIPFSLSLGQSLSSSLTHCIDPFSGALLMNSFEKYDPRQDKISTYDNQDINNNNNNNPDQHDGNENPSFGYGDYDGGGDYDNEDNEEGYQHGLNAMKNRNSDRLNNNNNGLSSKDIDDAKHNFMNVWKFLDMNEPNSVRDRPFKRGNTLRIPDYGASVSGVSDGPSTTKQQGKRKGTFAMFSQTSFPEFQYLSKKYHMMLSKKLSSGDGDSHSVIINNEIFSRKLAPFVRGDNDGRPYLGDRQHDFDDYDGGGDGYFGGYDDYDEHENNNNNNPADEANLPNIKGLNLSDEKDEKQNVNSIESLHLNNMQKQFKNFQLFSGLDDDDDVLPHENQAYIELVRSHVDQYIQMAQKWACNSKLAQTVHDWVKKIDPILEEEENRTPYDIHEYGDMVLDSAELKNSVPFSEIVQHCAPVKEESSDNIHPSIHIPKYEVGRLFLATLQLANDRKIEIDVSDSAFNVKKLV